MNKWKNRVLNAVISSIQQGIAQRGNVLTTLLIFSPLYRRYGLTRSLSIIILDFYYNNIYQFVSSVVTAEISQNT